MTKTKTLDDCVYYWIGGTESGRWQKAVGSDLRELRAEIERMGYRVVYGRSSIGAPDGPPKGGSRMNAKDLTGIIGELLENEVDAPQFVDTDKVSDLSWSSFEESGVMTSDDGMLLTVVDGEGRTREFQITVTETGLRGRS